MKIIYSLLLSLIILPHAWGTDAIPIDEFKKITDPSERAKLIDQAPPDQRDELRKIDLHLQLLTILGGEAGLKALKETTAAKTRGFAELEAVFLFGQTKVWDDYMAGVDDENHRAGMTREQLAAAWRKLQAERDIINKRLATIHSLVFNLAASPEASELEKRAEKVGEEIENRFGPEGSSPKKRITREERQAFDKQMDEIYAELQALPKLTPEQAQKEYDAIPDEKVGPW